MIGLLKTNIPRITLQLTRWTTMYCRVIPFRICVARWCFEFLPRTSWEKWFPRWGGGRYSSGGKATWVLFHAPPECTHFISCHDGGSLATDFWAALFRVEIQCVKLGVDCRAPAALLCDAFDYTETTEKKMICGMMKEVCAANWQFIDGVDGTQLAKRRLWKINDLVLAFGIVQYSWRAFW